MAAYALSGLQKRYRFEGVTYAVPDGGLRLIRPTKALPVRGCHLRCAGWRLTPYPAYKSATGSRVSLTLCRMAAYALSGLQKRYWFEGVTYAVPDGGLRLIRPTKAVPGCCRPDKRLRAIRHLPAIPLLPTIHPLPGNNLPVPSGKRAAQRHHYRQERTGDQRQMPVAAGVMHFPHQRRPAGGEQITH